MTERARRMLRAVNGVFVVLAILWFVAGLALAFALLQHRGPHEPLQTY